MTDFLTRNLPSALAGKIDRFVFIYATLSPLKGWVLLASLVSLGLGIASTILEPSAMALFAVAGAVGLAASAFQLYRSMVAVPHLEVERHFSRSALTNLAPSSEEEADGFHIVSDPDVPQATIMTSRSLNAKLRSDDDWVLRVDREFHDGLLQVLRQQAVELASVVRFFGRRFSDRDFRNESKLGICSPLLTTATEVRVCRTSYYEGFLTNDLCLSRLILAESDKPRVFYEPGYPVNSEARSNRVKALGSYPFTNGLGVSVIGFTRDRHIVFWRQNKRALVSRGLLAPTGSGSCDWGDYRKGATLKKTAIAAMSREFEEESLKRNSTTTKGAFRDVRLISYFRNLERGGKPELVALAVLEADLIQLVPNITEVDRGLAEHSTWRERPVGTVAELLDFVDGLLQSKSSREQLSVPLWMGLKALHDYWAEEEDGLAAFLGIPLSADPDSTVAPTLDRAGHVTAEQQGREELTSG